METMTDRTLSSNTILHYKTVPITQVVRPTRSKAINKAKLIRFAKNPLLWAAITWLSICAMLIIDVLHR
jgi:hypothetical protein